MINDGDRHEYKTRSSTGCILYTVIITTWMINDGDRHGYKTRSSTGCILYTVIITTVDDK